MTSQQQSQQTKIGSAETSLTNILYLNNQSYLIRCTFVTDNDFELCITDGTNTFFTKGSLSDIKSKSVEIAQHEQLLKQALMTLGRNSSFAFTIHTATAVPSVSSSSSSSSVSSASSSSSSSSRNQHTVLHFAIHSVLEHGQYMAGQVTLHMSSDASAVHMSLFTDLIERNERLKRVNQALEVKAKQRDEFLALSQQAIQQKEELERQLYSGFMHVLNSKKVHIRSKHDELRQLKTENDQLRGELDESRDRERRLKQQLSQLQQQQLQQHQQQKHGGTSSSSKIPLSRESNNSNIGSSGHHKVAFPMETPMKRRNVKAIETNGSPSDILDNLIDMDDDLTDFI